MADEEDGWSLTESSPEVFTAILQDIGVKGLQVDDVYSLDPGTLAQLQPIHALIFLFKWVGRTAEPGGPESGLMTGGVDGVYFANQVITNSCGTLAAINAVMNIPPQPSPYPGESIELGPMLTDLRDFGDGMDSMTCGELITNSPLIRSTHNSFTSSSPFSISQHPLAPKRPKEDAYHFVTYVPIMGALWELDGLQQAPIRHGPVDETDEGKWVKTAQEVIEKRIATYPEGSLMFNLLCIRSAPIPRLRRLLTSSETSPDILEEISNQLGYEQEKSRRWQLENSLRRHNLIPMVIEVLQIMASAPGTADRSALAVAKEKAREVGRQKRDKAVKEGMETD